MNKNVIYNTSKKQFEPAPLDNGGGTPGKDGENGADGADGKSAYEIALDNGFIGTESEWLESLKGKDGVSGANGEDGKSFVIDGWVAKVSDLPDATENTGKTFGTQEFGHLHHSDGTDWIDWGPFTGIKGDKGDKGEPGNNGTELPPSQANQILSTNDANQIVWENKKGVYESVQFSIPNNGDSRTFQLEGNLELKITRVATNNGKIELKSKVAQRVNLIYTSFRANGIENQAKNGNMAKDEVFPLDLWIFLDGAERNELLWWCPNDVVREVKFWLADDGLKGVFWKNKLT